MTTIRRRGGLPLAPGLACTAVALVLAAGPAHGQIAGPTITIDEVRPPQSPAFVLLGIAPAAVDRPDAPRALGASLLSLAGPGGTGLRNFALEMAPYWLTTRPAAHFDDYFRSSVAQQFVRTLSVSLAGTPRSLSGDTNTTSVGIGARALLAGGGPTSQLTALRDSLLHAQNACLLLEGAPYEDCVKGLRSLTLAIQAANHERVGVLVEVAGGVTGEFPNASPRKGVARRMGFWITPSYRWEKHIEAMAVGRFVWQRGDTAAGEGGSSAVDAGGRFLWRPVATVAVSVEALRRFTWGAGADPQSSRFGGLLELRATRDLYLYYAFGQDFAAKTGVPNRLISSLGLNLGFGDKPVVTVR
jgi:hypothetical protein